MQALDRVEIIVLMDNVTDSLSRVPGNVTLPRLTTREDAQALQRQVREDVNRAMQDAAAARASAEGQ